MARSFSPDGTEMVASLESTGESNWDLWVFPLSGDKQAYPLIASKHEEDFGRISPDGNWIAYQSDETGSLEIYLQAYPDLGSKIRVSRNGGQTPVWSHDGKELFFTSGVSPLGVKVMSVSIDLGPPLNASSPVELFTKTMFSDQLEVCPDGRFVFIEFPESLPKVDGVDVSVGWTQTLPQLVPN